MNATDDLAPHPRGEAALRGSPPHDLSAPYGTSTAEEDEAAERSLLEDLHALYEDGRSYAAAEMAFQKTRASFAGEKAKNAAIFGAAGGLLALLALIGLTVGLIIALTPMIGPWGATAVVVIVLLIAAFLCVRVAGKRWSELTSAFDSGGKDHR